MRNRIPWGVVAATLGVGGCRHAAGTTAAQERGAERLRHAVGPITNVIVYDICRRPQGSQEYVYSSIAVYEALRHGDTRYRSLAGRLNGLTTAPRPEPMTGIATAWPASS